MRRIKMLRDHDGFGAKLRRGTTQRLADEKLSDKLVDMGAAKWLDKPAPKAVKAKNKPDTKADKSEAKE